MPANTFLWLKEKLYRPTLLRQNPFLRSRKCFVTSVRYWFAKGHWH